LFLPPCCNKNDQVKVSLVAKNFAALLGSNFGVQFLRFLTIAWLARRLGNDIFGAYNYILLLLSYGFTLVEFGLRNFAIREFSQGRGSRKLAFEIIFTRLILAIGGVAAVMGLSYNALGKGGYSWPALILSASLFVDAFLVDFVVVARERLWAQALANVSQALFMAAGVFIFVHGPNDLMLVAGLFLTSHVLWVALFYLSVEWDESGAQTGAGSARPAVNWSMRIMWTTAVTGFPFLISQLMGGLQTTMDLLLLGQFHYQDWLGDYGAAMKVLGIALGVINAFISSVQPRFARESQDLSSPALHGLMNSATRMIWLFVAPTVAICWLFGGKLVYWFFGPLFIRAPELLKPLSLSLASICLSLPPLQSLYISHKTKIMVRVALFQVLTSFVFVLGALVARRPNFVPWAMFAAQFCNMLLAWSVFRSRNFISTEDVRTLLVPLTLLIGLLLLPVPSEWLKFALAVAGYGCGLLITQVWKRPWASALLGSVS
jgi:O-antigen/teichoic acid export membrane protein